MDNNSNYFMNEALILAKKAFSLGEIPIGAVIVKDNKIIAKAYNKRNKTRVSTHHAEILAIEKASKVIGDWRLEDCDMFVTTVPCPMCAGAIVNARIRKVYFGANNENFELFEKILKESSLNHKCVYCEGVMDKECSLLLKDFFKAKR